MRFFLSRKKSNSKTNHTTTNSIHSNDDHYQNDNYQYECNAYHIDSYQEHITIVSKNGRQLPPPTSSNKHNNTNYYVPTTSLITQTTPPKRNHHRDNMDRSLPKTRTVSQQQQVLLPHESSSSSSPHGNSLFVVSNQYPNVHDENHHDNDNNTNNEAKLVPPPLCRRRGENLHGLLSVSSSTTTTPPSFKTSLTQHRQEHHNNHDDNTTTTTTTTIPISTKTSTRNEKYWQSNHLDDDEIHHNKRRTSFDHDICDASSVVPQHMVDNNDNDDMIDMDHMIHDNSQQVQYNILRIVTPLLQQQEQPYDNDDDTLSECDIPIVVSKDIISSLDSRTISPQRNINDNNSNHKNRMMQNVCHRNIRQSSPTTTTNNNTIPHASLDASSNHHDILLIHNNYYWFSSDICMSLLHTGRDDDTTTNITNINHHHHTPMIFQKSVSKCMKYFQPVSQCRIQNACDQYIHHIANGLVQEQQQESKYHHVLDPKNIHDDDPTYKDISSTILYDPIKAKRMIMQFIEQQHTNYNSILIMLKHLIIRHEQWYHHLSKNNNILNHTTEIDRNVISKRKHNFTINPKSLNRLTTTTTTTIDTKNDQIKPIQSQLDKNYNDIHTNSNSNNLMTLIVLYGQITIICIAMSQMKDAIKYSTMAVQYISKLQHQQQEQIIPPTNTIKDNTNPITEMDQFQIIVIDTLHRHALVQYGINKISQCMKTIREVIQLAISYYGYESMMVSTLLCNIGICYYDCYNDTSCIRSLEQSIEIQKLLLRDGTKIVTHHHQDTTISIDHSIYRLAITMSNLAVVYDRCHQLHHAVSLLDECMTLYESISLDVTNDMHLTQQKLYQLTQRQDEHNGVMILKHTPGAVDISTTDINSSTEATEIDQDLQPLGFNCSTLYNDLNQSNSSDDTLRIFLDMTIAYDEDEDDDDGGETQYHTNTEVDEQSILSDRSMILFGNCDGLPNRMKPSTPSRKQINNQALFMLESSDNYDYLLLGVLQPEPTAEQRVRATILSWYCCHMNNPFDRIQHDNNRQKNIPSVEISKMHVINNNNNSNNNNRNKTKKQILNGDLRSDDNDPEIVVANHNNNDTDLYLHDIHKQAMVYIDQQLYDDAIVLFRRLISNYENKYGTKVHYLIANAYYNIGLIQLIAYQYEDAITTLENVVLLRTEIYGMDHPDVHITLMKLSLLHFAMGDTHQAHDTLWDIHEMLIHNTNHDDDDNNNDQNRHNNHHHHIASVLQLSKVNNNIGVMAYEFGDIENALSSFQCAYQYQRQVYKHYMNNTNRRSHTQGQHGGCNGGDGDNFHSSMNHMEHNRDIIQLAKVHILCNIAYIYHKQGDMEHAIDVYDRAYHIVSSIHDMYQTGTTTTTTTTSSTTIRRRMNITSVYPMTYYKVLMTEIRNNIDVLVEGIYHHHVKNQ